MNRPLLSIAIDALDLACAIVPSATMIIDPCGAPAALNRWTNTLGSRPSVGASQATTKSPAAVRATLGRRWSLRGSTTDAPNSPATGAPVTPNRRPKTPHVDAAPWLKLSQTATAP